MGRKQEILKELGLEDSVIFVNPDYDDAIIGVTEEGVVVYSYERMVECLSKEDNISYEEAIDFIDYNTLCCSCSFNPEGTPIVMFNESEFDDKEQELQSLREENAQLREELRKHKGEE